MRWTLNCILLASIAVISASEDDARIKRDLTFIKNLVSAKLFGVEHPGPTKVLVRPPGNYRLFRIPGFEKILVKATPKRVGIETVGPNNVVQVSQSAATIAQNPNIAIVNSYLGTSQLNETLYALQGVRNLLQSGVLEAQREEVESSSSGSFTTGVGVVESGKLVVGQRPYTVGESIPVPMIEGYRPVEITRLPDLPIPTKYSYKQVNHDEVMSYTAKDNKNVIVTKTNRPVPLPPYVTYRIQEVMSLGARPIPTVVTTAIKTPPPVIPVYNVPKVQVISPPVKLMPTVVSYNEVPLPQVLVPPPPPPVKVTVANVPTAYSYNHIHNDGSVTSYSGSGDVLERKGVRPPVVVTEISKPAPLPIFLTNRIEKAAATAMAARIPHGLYETPIVYRQSHPVIIEETPMNYDHVTHWPPYKPYDYRRPLYREDINIYLAKNKKTRPVAVPNGPAEYSYKKVHADGSVTTYSNAGVFEEGSHGFDKSRPISFSGKYPETYNNYQHVHHPHLVREEICLDPPVLYPHLNAHVHASHSKPTGYSYKTVHSDGLLTTYSGSGHVNNHIESHLHPVPMINPLPPVMIPEVVTPGEFISENPDAPEKIMFPEPIVSQYVYKQINHNDPNTFTGAELGSVNVDGEVNVQVGEVPVPKPYLSPPPPPSLPSSNQLPVSPSVTPSGSNSYVYIPPSDIVVPLPTSKPVDGDKAESGHSFTHVTNEGVHTNKDGAASFESITPSPVVTIEKTSSSISVSKSKSRPKGKSGRPRVRTTTEDPNQTVSLSSNPIVVMPEEPTFSFKQDRADGSSITVVGNKENVSVIEDNKTDESQHRGDIPNTSF